ncbi:hypothetical protein QW131_24485 [Roseibium salinum]|nr:hypothetical protein [Roseibium salinum]
MVLAGQLTHSLHLYGAVCGLASGQEVVLLPRFEPRAVLAELRNAPAGAVLYATPTQLHYLAEGASRGEPVETVVQVFRKRRQMAGRGPPGPAQGVSQGRSDRILRRLGSQLHHRRQT